MTCRRDDLARGEKSERAKDREYSNMDKSSLASFIDAGNAGSIVANGCERKFYEMWRDEDN